MNPESGVNPEQDILDGTHQPAAIEKGSLFQRVQSEWITLARLGTPILIAQLAYMANGVIDTLMSGRASAEDLTGVAIGTSIWMPIFLLVLGILNAQQPLISGYNGAKKDEQIMPVVWHGIYIALFASLVAIFVLSQLGPLLELLELEAKPAQITMGYLFAFSWGIPAIFLLLSLRGLTDGLGYTKIIMVFTLISVVINTPLNYIFIFGKFGFPALGGVGCGWATTISNWIGLFALIFYLHRAAAFKQFHIWSHRMLPIKQQMLTLLRLGVPIGFTIFVEATMFSVITLLLAPLGTFIIAGHQIAYNIISVLFMVPLSLGIAIMLRTSFLIGAEQPDTARLVARSSILLAMIIAFSFALLLMTNRETFTGFYSTNPEVLDIAVHLLWFGAIFQMVDVIQVNCIHALRGYKDTRIPMYIMLISFWIIGLPVGYILTFKDWIVPAMGAEGFWIGLIAGLSHAAIWLSLRLFWVSGRN